MNYTARAGGVTRLRSPSCCHIIINRWQIHPYNPANNINYTYDESGFAARYPHHPGANQQPFFFTTPKQRDNRIVLRVQQRFVERMLQHALPYHHVLYCMDNETNGAAEWGRYWANFVKQRAAEKGRHVYVTEMWDDWNLSTALHKRTFDHPELYDFVDVSQNNHNRGQKHWDNFLLVRKYLSRQPRPMNTTKTYGATGNKFGHTDQDGIERFWRHLLAGAASIRFHRPDSGLGLNDKAVASIRAARKLEAIVPLWSVEAANELLSERSDNKAYMWPRRKGKPTSSTFQRAARSPWMCRTSKDRWSRNGSASQPASGVPGSRSLAAAKSNWPHPTTRIGSPHWSLPDARFRPRLPGDLPKDRLRASDRRVRAARAVN